MGGADVEFERYDLPGCVGLHVCGVVLELVTLAEPDVALGGVVVGLGGGHLELALDVAVVVSLLVIVDLLATGGFHGSANYTRLRRGDHSVAVDSDGQAGHGKSRCSVLHVDWRTMWGWQEKVRSKAIAPSAIKKVGKNECIGHRP